MQPAAPRRGALLGAARRADGSTHGTDPANAPATLRSASLLLGCTAIAALVACDSAGLQRAYMALDNTGARKRTQFFTDTQAIWCDAQYSSGRTDLTIDVELRSTALWDDATQQMVPAHVVYANGELPAQVGVGGIAAFQWVALLPNGGGTAPPGTVPYPVGDFVCDITLDGQLAASLPFTVAYPACPVPAVEENAMCAGWVEEGSLCPDAVGRECRCTEGVWTC